MVMSKGTSNRIEKQLEIFREGIPRFVLSSAANSGSGIKKLSEQELLDFEQIYVTADVDVEKFVPASGAATRMFKNLLELKNTGKVSEQTQLFFQHLDKFSFDLSGSNEEEILSNLFDLRRMDKFPKGLLPFHSSGDKTRTAAEEHLIEGAGYAMKNNKVQLHFTVSLEHIKSFKKHLKAASEKQSADFKITYSTQNPETDTIAADLTNEPFKDENGELVFRPAGHGALLENLNQLDADIIFIKNIDNVVPDRLKSETIKYKKVLAGVLLDYQRKIFELLERNKNGENVSREGKILLEEVGLKGEFSTHEVIDQLNRPIRVCGMVQNQGEPGGGPFWVHSNKGQETLQIVESAQINLRDTEQETIFKHSTHFNPVDLVCGVKNYKGEKFDLMKYRDENTGFISQKSYKGQAIKALELPGLWNGGMADWNTLFVEVPLITFNPVKTVNDLLKPAHQG